MAKPQINSPNADFLRWVKKHKLGGKDYPKFEKLNRGQKSALTKLFVKLEAPFKNPASYVVRKTDKQRAKMAGRLGYTTVGIHVIVHAAINAKVKISKQGVEINAPTGRYRNVDAEPYFMGDIFPELKPGDYIRVISEWGGATLTNQEEWAAWLYRYKDFVREEIAEGKIYKFEIVTGRMQRIYNKAQRDDLSQAIESWNESGRMRK